MVDARGEADSGALSRSCAMASSSAATLVVDSTCFGRPKGPQRHWASVDKLHKAGVWIGHLSPALQAQPYKGLPSYAQLLQNCQAFSGPFPESIQGKPFHEQRQAICLGCISDHSQLITLCELRFTDGRVSWRAYAKADHVC